MDHSCVLEKPKLSFGMSKLNGDIDTQVVKEIYNLQARFE